MININNYLLPKYVEYKVNVKRIADSKNSFTAANGEAVQPVINTLRTISISCRNLSSEMLKTLSEKIPVGRTVIKYTDIDGTDKTGYFICSEIPADLKFNFTDTEKKKDQIWDLSLNFTEVSYK